MNPVTAALVIGIAGALAFNFTNGFHDSSNAVAGLVATRSAGPVQAVTLAAVFNVLGPLLAGTAVANTIGGILVIQPRHTLALVGAALTGALAWNIVTWWRGLPSSSSHALVGGLVGAGVVEAGFGAVRWGGLRGIHPFGVLGVLASLAISPVLGFAVGFVTQRLAHRGLARARREVARPIRGGVWAAAAALAFSHGANDGQKTMGVITLMLLAAGQVSTFSVPLWVILASALSLTIGTAFGGWRIVRTLGSGIYRLRPLDGFLMEADSAVIILAAALVGGPVSTTHVVASSVAGVGAGQRWRHVRWPLVADIGLAWLITIPASAIIASLALPLWRLFA